MDYFDTNYISGLYLQDNNEDKIDTYIILTENVYDTILNRINFNFLLIIFTFSSLSLLISCKIKPIVNKYSPIEYVPIENKDKIQTIKGEVV